MSPTSNMFISSVEETYTSVSGNTAQSLYTEESNVIDNAINTEIDFNLDINGKTEISEKKKRTSLYNFNKWVIKDICMLSLIYVTLILFLLIKYNSYMDIKRSETELITRSNLHRLIATIQFERDMAIFQRSKIGKLNTMNTMMYLMSSQYDTDREMGSTKYWINNERNSNETFVDFEGTNVITIDDNYLEEESEDMPIDTFLKVVLVNRYHFIKSLVHCRRRARYLSIVKCYNKLVMFLLKVINGNVVYSTCGSSWKPWNAYIDILRATEGLHVQKLMGILFFLNKNFTSDEMDMFNNGSAMYRVYTNYATRLIPGELIANHINSQYIYLQKYMQKYESKMRFNNSRNLNLSSYWQWNNNIDTVANETRTGYLNMLRLSTTKLSNNIQDYWNSLILNMVLGIIVAFSSPYVFVSIDQSIDSLENHKKTVFKDELYLDNKRIHNLLDQIFPLSISRLIAKNQVVKPRYYSSISVCFSEISNYNKFFTKLSSFQMVNTLETLYSIFDKHIERHDVYKLETIGDSVMIASGIPDRNGHDHAIYLSRMCSNIMNEAVDCHFQYVPQDAIHLKFGIHSGPCVGGLVGYINPRFCLFGDSVNTASRMVTSGVENRIQISDMTYALVKDTFVVEERGYIEVKSKGTMKVYLLGPEKSKYDQLVLSDNDFLTTVLNTQEYDITLDDDYITSGQSEKEKCFIKIDSSKSFSKEYSEVQLFNSEQNLANIQGAFQEEIESVINNANDNPVKEGDPVNDAGKKETIDRSLALQESQSSGEKSYLNQNDDDDDNDKSSITQQDDASKAADCGRKDSRPKNTEETSDDCKSSCQGDPVCRDDESTPASNCKPTGASELDIKEFLNEGKSSTGEAKTKGSESTAVDDKTLVNYGIPENPAESIKESLKIYNESQLYNMSYSTKGIQDETNSFEANIVISPPSTSPRHETSKIHKPTPQEKSSER